MRKLLLATIIACVGLSPALAQTPPATSKTTPPAKTETKARTPESLECSKQADAKGLHGKERKTFRAQCMKEKKGKA
jgi:hypothetical protein